MTPLTGIYQIEGAGRAQIIAVEGLRDLNHAPALGHVSGFLGYLGYPAVLGTQAGLLASRSHGPGR